MRSQFFPTNAKTADDHEAANIITSILIGMHQKGEIQEAFKTIYDKGWQNYLPMARAILEYECKKSQAYADRLQRLIREELQQKDFNSNEAGTALRALNNLSHMNVNTQDEIAKYGSKVGYHFQDGWESLSKACVQFQAAANKDRELIQLVDAEIRKHQQPTLSM